MFQDYVSTEKHLKYNGYEDLYLWNILDIF